MSVVYPGRPHDVVSSFQSVRTSSMHSPSGGQTGNYAPAAILAYDWLVTNHML